MPELDGSGPICRLVADSQGNLYGTTRDYGPTGGGTVFKISPTREYTVLHSFSADGPEGNGPIAGLTRDAQGNLYGTTEGGALCGVCGTVFKLDPTGNVTVLHSFDMTDGGNPYAELVQDSAGNIYGTTFFGGEGLHASGVIFKITPQ